MGRLEGNSRTEPLLKIDRLTTSFRIGDHYYPAVDNVSLTVHNDEVLAIVGESGCGKSALALSLMRLHNRDKTKMDGHVFFQGQDVLTMNRHQLDKLRGKGMGMIFQDSLTALNPLMTIERQIQESMDYHTNFKKHDKRRRTIELLHKVGIRQPEVVAKQYPHELSGGMRQRVMIALAIACDPELVIADEPTTALDVTIQAQIIDLLKTLQQQMHSGIILITHDLGVVAEMADRVAVMYAGEIVELANITTLFAHPLHPYTRSLLNSIPSMNDDRDRLHVIHGIVPSLQHLPHMGCRFAPRIPWIPKEAHEENPQLREVEEDHLVRCTCYKHFAFPKVIREGVINGAS
jgi:peptide/nickel transport system ATP-binding protein